MSVVIVEVEVANQRMVGKMPLPLVETVRLSYNEQVASTSYDAHLQDLRWT